MDNAASKIAMALVRYLLLRTDRLSRGSLPSALVPLWLILEYQDHSDSNVPPNHATLPSGMIARSTPLSVPTSRRVPSWLLCLFWNISFNTSLAPPPLIPLGELRRDLGLSEGLIDPLRWSWERDGDLNEEERREGALLVFVDCRPSTVSLPQIPWYAK